MLREDNLFLNDILHACEKVIAFSADFTQDTFFKDAKTHDAVLHNLQIIGEAVKHLSTDTKAQYKEVGWRKIAGLRDMIVHEYFGLDAHILWDIIKNEVPRLREQIKNVKP